MLDEFNIITIILINIIKFEINIISIKKYRIDLKGKINYYYYY